MKRLALLSVCLLLSSCGYHLMGMGRGVVPNDVQVLRVVDAGNSDRFVTSWLSFLRDHANGYRVVSATSGEKADAEMHVGKINESLAPITYDANGLVTVDRMTLSGEISLWVGGQSTWSSGSISAYEDVDVSGGPTAIESAKQRIRSDIETQWMQQAWLKLSSGF